MFLQTIYRNIIQFLYVVDSFTLNVQIIELLKLLFAIKNLVDNKKGPRECHLDNDLFL